MQRPGLERDVVDPGVYDIETFNERTRSIVPA